MRTAGNTVHEIVPTDQLAPRRSTHAPRGTSGSLTLLLSSIRKQQCAQSRRDGRAGRRSEGPGRGRDGTTVRLGDRRQPAVWRIRLRGGMGSRSGVRGRSRRAAPSGLVPPASRPPAANPDRSSCCYEASGSNNLSGLGGVGTRARRDARRVGTQRALRGAQRPLQIFGGGVGIAGGPGAAGDDIARNGIPKPAEKKVAHAQADDRADDRAKPGLDAGDEQCGEDRGKQSDTNEAVGDPGFHGASVFTQAGCSLRA